MEVYEFGEKFRFTYDPKNEEHMKDIEDYIWLKEICESKLYDLLSCQWFRDELKHYYALTEMENIQFISMKMGLLHKISSCLSDTDIQRIVELFYIDKLNYVNKYTIIYVLSNMVILRKEALIDGYKKYMSLKYPNQTEGTINCIKVYLSSKYKLSLVFCDIQYIFYNLKKATNYEDKIIETNDEYYKSKDKVIEPEDEADDKKSILCKICEMYKMCWAKKYCKLTPIYEKLPSKEL